MGSSALRTLQHENVRLQKEMDIFKQENLSLYSYLKMIEKLYWATLQIATRSDPFGELNRLFYEALQTMNASDGSLLYLDKAADELVFVIVHGNLQQQLPGYRLKSDVGFAGWVMSHHEPIIVNNPRQDWRFSLSVDQQFRFFTRTILSVPILASETEVLGVIQILNKYAAKFTEADLALAVMVSQVATKVLQVTPDILQNIPPMAESSLPDELFT